jgi:hypothetical protein
MGLKRYRLWVMGQLDSNVQRAPPLPPALPLPSGHQSVGMTLCAPAMSVPRCSAAG